MEGVSRENLGNYNYPVGYGYVTIPTNIDRESYIQTCYRKERIAVQLDSGGGVINNCYITKQAIQDVIFPNNPDELGSCVVFMCPQFNNLPIVIGVVSKPDESQLLEDLSFKKIVSSRGAKVSIEGKGKTGELFINVESDDEGEAGVFVTLNSKNNTAKFKVNCFGDINLYSEGETYLKSLKNVKLEKIKIDGNREVVSSRIELSDDGYEITDSSGNSIISNSNGEIKIFGGDSPIPKGDELNNQLEVMKNRIDTIINSLQSAPASTIQAYSAAIIASLSMITRVEDFASMNSDKIFIE